MNKKIILFPLFMFIFCLLMYKILVETPVDSFNNQNKELLITQSTENSTDIVITNSSSRRLIWETSKTEVMTQSKNKWLPVETILPKVIIKEYIDSGATSIFPLQDYITNNSAENYKLVFFFSYDNEPEFSYEFELKIP
ncbi:MULTISPECIES: hypothetical protein [Vagococcus]|uniref:Uncharacterized protein n=1 Tax=Vagococcus fluvialis bH819 TaxID=1255619 RepID=A0A1X6WMS8_9ENTE|nr:MULTISPECIES: hypothetical protein [Vagococcus]SLM85558.1 hypothetical protein FM121_05620 [Vagococcus fluvialis bH819]HCM89525.1 hypothetical protein [Vagococcus sp.]